MKRIILPAFLMLGAALVVMAQEQPPVLDPQFGVKSFSDPDYVSPYTIKQSLDGGYYLAASMV